MFYLGQPRLTPIIVSLAATHYFIYSAGVHRGRSRTESWIYADRQPRNRWAEFGQPFDHLFRRLGLNLGLMELLGAYTYHSQWGQDRWISERVFPGVKARISDLAPLTARVYTLTRRSATISPPERDAG